MRRYLTLLYQSFILSLQEIWASRLRSFLSLLGISIGIICIISVRTAVNSLEQNIQKGLASFGNDILYVQKWPWIWTDNKNYPWWRFLNRPVANQNEMKLLKERLTGAEAVCMIYFAGSQDLTYGKAVAERVSIMGVTFDYPKIKNLEFVDGRFFTQQEINSGSPVAILGARTAKMLLETGSMEGEEVKIKGRKVKVIGVLKSEGDDLFGLTLDDNIVLPFAYLRNVINLKGGEGDPFIAVMPRDGIPISELKLEIKGAMRAIRRIPPKGEDNFAINQVSVFSEGIKSVFAVVNMAGWFIGLFSIVVGAFGIANIMFVSVKERTYIIGIKKAIGAQKVFILFEFLMESVMLCVLGGLLGMLVVVGLFQGLEYVMFNFFDTAFEFYITKENVLIGLGISIGTGILAGFVPAYSAANMRPVDAIRS